MGRCRRHPQHVVVGVCAFCLNENLSTLVRKGQEPSSTHIKFSIQEKPPIAVTASISSASHSAAFPDTLLLDHRHAHEAHLVVDSTTSRASTNRFSVPLSPLPRHKSQKTSTSSNISPLINQAFLGNQDFIKGEIPRKSRSPFWSFLHKRKDGDLDSSIGVAHWHHDNGQENVPRDPIYDNDDADGAQAHGFHLPAAALMRASNDKGQLDRHTLSKMAPSLMRDAPAGSSNAHAFVPHATQLPKKAYLQRLSPSKKDYFHHPSSRERTIRQSPSKSEAHGEDEDEFLRGQHGVDNSPQAHYLHGSQGNIDDRKNQFGGSSSWISSLFPQRIRRSKSISGLHDVCMSEPPLQHVHRASPDVGPSNWSRPPVPFAEKAGVPKCMPIKVSRSRKLLKGDVNQSPNMHMHLAQGQSKSPSVKSSSFHGLFGKGSSEAAAYASYTNHTAQGPTDFSSFDAHVYRSPQSIKPISNVFSKKRSETVSVECGKEYSRVSPIAMLDMKGQSSKGPVIPCSDEYVSLHHHHQVRPLSQNAGGRLVPRGSPKFELLGESSSRLPSDDEFRKSPMSAMREHMQSPKLALIATKRVKAQDESAMSWGKALKKTFAPMLGIGRGKKQRQADITIAAHHETNQYGVQEHSMDDMRNERNAHAQNALQDDDDYVIDFNHNYQDQSHSKHAHGSIKAPGLHVRESHVLPGSDSRGAPQQYSFLSRDYSAFSFYFSPHQGSGSAEEASFSSLTPVQSGTGEICLAEPC